MRPGIPVGIRHRSLPCELGVTVAEQRVDERTEIAATQRRAGGVTLELPGIDRFGSCSQPGVGRKRRHPLVLGAA